MSAVDERDPPRYPLPGRLPQRAAALARWLALLASAQGTLTRAALAIFGVGSLFVMNTFGVVHRATALIAVILGIVALLFRQSQLLESSADAFGGVGSDPAAAHTHLHVAFSRLRSVLVIDGILGALAIAAITVWMVMP